MDLETDYKLVKMFKKRKRGGNEELLVKWLEWAEKLNSWAKKIDFI